MITKDDRRQRWRSTARTALAGAVLGGIGGALTGVLVLLVDSTFSPDQALARAILAVCCAVLTAAVTAWSLSPGPVQAVGAVLAAVAAAVAAWAAAPWCFRPLRGAGDPIT
jgi:hypothetical protein